MRINPFENNRVPTVAACKCCGGTAHIVGVTDFARCGIDMIAEVMATGQPLGPASIVTRKVEPYSGWAIYYYRCVGCLFTFTPAFDAWDHADFGRHVYNADYARHDPEYNDVRPRQYAELMLSLFGRWRHSLTILDYGAGLGLLERNLQQQGFAHVTSYDPYTHAGRPSDVHDLIVCVEVFEHVPDPVALMQDMKSFLRDGGAILFSTLCCSQEVIDAGVANWWYCVPRNGHISFYSPQSLSLLAGQHALQYRQLGDSLHLMHHHDIPDWLDVLLTGAQK